MDSLLAVSPLPFLSRRDLHSGRRGRGRRGNIALQCMKQFFSLSLSFLPGGHFQTLLPPSDQISPPVVAVILAAIRPVSWFMARDVSNSFFFSSFLLLSSSKKNFYSFVRLFMDGSISTRSKKYEESRINTNAGGGGGDLVEIWDIFIDRRDGLKYRQMCNRWTVTLLFGIERRRDFSDSYSSYY